MSGLPDARTQLSGLIFAVLLLDEDLCIVEANPSAEDLLGKSEKRLKKHNVVDLLDIGDLRMSRELRRADMRLVARAVSARIEGREVLLNITVSPVATEPNWLVMTLSEIASNQMGDYGESAAKPAAPNILAHEIKNPLSAIRGAGQLLSRKLEESERSLANLIVSEADRIADVIDRMQQLGSTSREALSACNPHSAIRNALRTVKTAQDTLEGEPMVFVEEFDPSLPPVLAQPQALEQVLINLLANACDAGRSAGEHTVSVRTRFVSGSVFKAIRLGKATHLPVEISIVDRGAGIDRELAERVFEPFVSSKPHGQGLGLALARKLIEDMSGRISHERLDRTGETVFRVFLPVAKPEAATQENGL